MRAPPINRITTDSSPLTRQPENRMIYRIPLQRAQKRNRTLRVPVQHEETESELLWFARRFRDALLPKYGWPVLYLVVVFPVDAREDVRCCVKFGPREGIQDGVGGEEVVWMVVGYEDCFQRIGSRVLDPVDHRIGILHEEWGVD